MSERAGEHCVQKYHQEEPSEKMKGRTKGANRDHKIGLPILLRAQRSMVRDENLIVSRNATTRCVLMKPIFVLKNSVFQKMQKIFFTIANGPTVSELPLQY